MQEALRAADIEYEKVVAAHGSPIPFLRKGSRDELPTGSTKLPALKLPDGTVITHSGPSSPGSISSSDLAALANRGGHREMLR